MSNYATNMNKDFAERLGSPEAPNPLLSNATRKVKRRKVAEDERKRAVRAYVPHWIAIEVLPCPVTDIRLVATDAAG